VAQTQLDSSLIKKHHKAVKKMYNDKQRNTSNL